jgi:hypothetical protein
MTVQLGSEINFMSFSLTDSVRSFWQGGLRPLSILVALFSGAYPYFKILVITFVAIVKRDTRTSIALHCVDILGRFSFLDSLIATVMVTSLQIPNVAVVHTHRSLYMFIAAIALNILAGNIANQTHDVGAWYPQWRRKRYMEKKSRGILPDEDRQSAIRKFMSSWLRAVYWEESTHLERKIRVVKRRLDFLRNRAAGGQDGDEVRGAAIEANNAAAAALGELETTESGVITPPSENADVVADEEPSAGVSTRRVLCVLFYILAIAVVVSMTTLAYLKPSLIYHFSGMLKMTKGATAAYDYQKLWDQSPMILRVAGYFLIYAMPIAFVVIPYRRARLFFITWCASDVFLVTIYAALTQLHGFLITAAGPMLGPLLGATVQMTGWVGCIFAVVAMQTLILALVLKSHDKQNKLEVELEQLETELAVAEADAAALALATPSAAGGRAGRRCANSGSSTPAIALSPASAAVEVAANKSAHDDPRRRRLLHVAPPPLWKYVDVFQTLFK